MRTTRILLSKKLEKSSYPMGLFVLLSGVEGQLASDLNTPIRK